ncbi:hypothetical protein V5O48_000670 [Marasmius crinis-equi]|uniref:DUF6699 domain-containing protein n=1 Tax=Marasmius crinis-equi TaxID=585013 RepID=A0ABR3G0Q0_9AGAR
MPGINKHVHWASPSPPSSISSLPSTPGPLTPQEPSGIYTYRPLPVVGGPVNLHQSLGYTPLKWDLTLQPNADAMNVPATHPPMPFIVVTVAPLGWSIPIHPMGKTNCVTVSDVLEGIYRFLREPITREQHAHLSPQHRPKVEQSFHRRVARYREPQLEKLERSKGLKKVDMLMGQTVFRGLTPREAGGTDYWELQVSFP